MTSSSVIANAPFIVWIERTSGSLIGCGPLAAQAASQASTVSRWPATSGLRISSSTGSIENAPASGSASASGSNTTGAGSGSGAGAAATVAGSAATASSTSAGAAAAAAAATLGT